MHPVKKRILVDENQEPIAVQIDYRDWLEIERRLSGHSEELAASMDLNSLRGSIRLRDDPLDFQSRIRGEW